MQVTPVTTSGLKHEFKITVPADEIEQRMTGRLADLGQRIRVPGFRPGKVPVALLRKQHGQRVLGEILEETVNEGSRQAISEHELKPALRPKIEVTAFGEGNDLEFTMAVEVLPDVPEVDLKAIALTRPKAEVGEDRVEETLGRLALSRATYATPAEPRPAAKGDRVVVDFLGRVGGEPFEGGEGKDVAVVLGTGMMVPGFEDGLIGVGAGETKRVELTFPEDYPSEDLAGKPAAFDVELKTIEAPEVPALDDEFAKGFGVEGLVELRQRVREQIEREFATAGRLKAKRRLLDRLAADHGFEVPQGMVDMEFDAIWQRLTDEMKTANQTFEETGSTEEASRAEYRAIAERRVRLGLLLSDIGTRNEIKVEQPELQAAVLAQARRFPGQERQVLEYFQKNPQAIEQLRAPIFEDKVVDFVLELAKVEDEPVSAEELFADDDVPPEMAAVQAARAAD
jgi:trigger factor